MPSRKAVHWIVRIAVSAAVLAVIFHIVPFREVIATAQRLPLWVWAAGFALFLIGHALTAMKWWLLIDAGIPFATAVRAHLAGLGANLALPGVAGGDVVRAAIVLRQARDAGRLAIGSVADRLIDTIGLGMVALAGAAAAWHASWEAAALVAIVVTAGLCLTVFVLRQPLAGWAARHVGDGKPGRIVTRALTLLEELARQPRLLLFALTLSIMVQCLFVGINIAFAVALGLDLPAAAWFYAWASAKIIAIAPISLGGLGVREASMAALLKPFGADTGAVIAVGLIWQTVLYASGIFGIILQTGLAGVRRASPYPAKTKEA